MTIFFDKINKSILFVPKMKMDTTLTLDGEKISEFVFDNTQAKKHIKFFWAPDAFTKDYLFTDEWEYTGTKGIKWNTDLKRGGVSIWNYVGDYSWVNNANKFEIKMMDKIMAEGEKFYHIKLDTRATPYTLVWFHQPVRSLFPTTRDVTGQDELTVSAWHTPGKELKIETNFPEFRTMKVTSAGPT